MNRNLQGKEKEMNNSLNCFALNNNVKIPSVGFGTWLIENGDEAVGIVSRALQSGYRHIDTAAAYGNEESVGKAVRESGIPRSEIFVTSKVWNTERGYDKTMAAFEKTMEKLGLDYLDLYLIHWPCNVGDKEDWSRVNYDTWRALQRLYADGRARAIGVSNFKVHHLEQLLKNCSVVPMVNQIEFHPGFMQKDIIDFCRSNKILPEAWSPLGRGRMAGSELLQNLAGKYGKSIAQICIRWCLQNGVLPLPKTVNESRMAENADVFKFEISDEDMELINNMEQFGWSGHDPDTFE